jgi:hypothetical protein
MTTYTIQYRATPDDDWDFSALNDNDQGYSNLNDAIVGMFTNAKKLIERFLNIPHNDYRIVDENGIQLIFYPVTQFTQMLEQFELEPNNQFEIQT